MQESQYLAAADKMVQETIRRGHQPLTFVMNEKTSLEIAGELAERHKRKLSLIGRAWYRFRYRDIPPKMDTLCGVPVTLSPIMADGALFLQCGALVRGPGNVPGVPSAPAEAQNNAPMPDFLKKERAQPAEAEQDSAEIRPTLDDLARGSGDRPSASDVLMKALEDAENLIGVVVVRVHKDSSVDLCLNCNFFEAQGVLQKAQYWLATRGEG